MTLPLAWIPDVLKAAGLVVVPYAGWETRQTKPGITVRGVVCHHTATGPGTSNTAVARLLAVGRSDLKGPLAQLGLDRDGHFWMISAGRCNHNGYGTWGNDSIGIEAYNDGKGELWPAVQIDAYERGCAALIAHVGLSVAEVRAHRETDPKRKIDPRGIDMDTFRAHVAGYLHPIPPIPPEDDMLIVIHPTDGRQHLLFAGKLVYIAGPAGIPPGVPEWRPDAATWVNIDTAYGPGVGG